MAGNSIGSWPRMWGWALAAVVLLQLAVGFYLNSGYGTTPSEAIASVQATRSDALGRFLQGIHYWGSGGLIAMSLFFLAALLAKGTYLKLPKPVWVGAVALFGSAFGLQVTGNLLPFDQHDVQTAVIEGGIASRVPLAGSMAASTLLAGDTFSPSTLAAWHRYHLWLLVPLILGTGAVLFGTPKPDRSRRMWAFPAVCLLAIAGLAALLGAPHGAPGTEADFAAFDARPSWYTWPMHGALNGFESLAASAGWIGAAVLPGILGAALLFAPWIGQKRDGLARGSVFGLLAAFFGLGVAFGGTAAPAWGEQTVPQTFVSEPNADPVDEALASAGESLAKMHCVGCHGEGLAGGPGAPNLMTAYQRHSDADWYVRFLRNPSSVKPGSTMPAMAHLSDSEIAELAEFLRKPKG